MTQGKGGLGEKGMEETKMAALPFAMNLREGSEPWAEWLVAESWVTGNLGKGRGQQDKLI